MSRALSISMSGIFYSGLITVIKIGNWGSKLTVTAYVEKESSFHLLMHLVLLQSISVARALDLLKVISLGAVPASRLTWKGQGCHLWSRADGGGSIPDISTGHLKIRSTLSMHGCSAYQQECSSSKAVATPASAARREGKGKGLKREGKGANKWMGKKRCNNEESWQWPCAAVWYIHNTCRSPGVWPMVQGKLV